MNKVLSVFHAVTFNKGAKKFDFESFQIMTKSLCPIRLRFLRKHLF